MLCVTEVWCQTQGKTQDVMGLDSVTLLKSGAL